MSEAQVVSLACPSGVPFAGQSCIASAGGVPDSMTACVSNAYNALWSCSMTGHRHGVSPGWVRKRLYLYQVTTSVSYRMEEGLQNTLETKQRRKCQIISFSYLEAPK